MPRGLSPVHPLELNVPSPLEQLDDDRLTRRGVRVLLKRDDLIHPDFPGNKWRKLAPNLAAAREQGHTTLLTFGGAYSNHLRAVAAAGHHFGFQTVGVVRGEEHLPLNEVLAAASDFGMRLTYLDRAAYRDKTRQTRLTDSAPSSATATSCRKAAATPWPYVAARKSLTRSPSPSM
jgi:1-aminocyclopropane-1-carboxylate deaminase